MDANRFRRLMDLVGEASQRPEPDRSAWLAAECRDEAELLAEARSLLEEATPSLETVMRRLEAEIARAASTATKAQVSIPDRVGSYAVTGVLGEGGMGIVYAARQAAPLARDVAIKVIRAGPHAPRMVARFEAERRTLAALDHAYIAHIFDAGATAEGLPFFAMELVRGEPITTYCDKRALGLTQRLRLFLDVLDAVQYAHQKAVVHRDLKPSNVLVTERAGHHVPKIIDFGVAKVTSGEPDFATAHTTQGAVVGTLEYMSPEQALGLTDGVDTRSDVYALGVLLYELLTGCLPFEPAALRTATPAELERLFRDTDPPTPSKRVATTVDGSADRARSRATDPNRLSRALQGDLDNIVGVAMRKEPERRYATVAQLSEDIARYLDGRPVSAHPATVWYRARRFVGRNRLAVLGGAAAMLVLLVVSALFTLRLAEERDRAHAEAVKATQVAEFLEEIFQVSDPSLTTTREVSARQLLDQGARRIASELAGQPAVQASLLSVMGRTYSGLGHSAEAERLVREALTVQRRVYGERHPEVARTLQQLGNVLLDLTNLTASEDAVRAALAMRMELLGDRDTATAVSLTQLALVLRARGKFDEAEQVARQAVDIHRQSGAGESRGLSISLHNLAFVLRSKNRERDAEEVYREALAMKRRLLDPTDPEVLLTMANLAVLLDARGEHAEAERLHREVLAGRRDRLGAEHPQTLTVLNNLATNLWRTGRFGDASVVFREAVEVGRRVYGGDHASLAIMINNLGVAERRSGNLADAEAHHREALEMNRRLKAQPRIAGDLDNLGRVLLARGDVAGATRMHNEALALRTRLHGPDNPDIAESLSALGEARLAAGALAEAERILRRALALRTARLNAQDPRVAQSSFDLAVAVRARGEYAESERLLRSALEIRKSRLGDGHPDVAAVLRELGVLKRLTRRYAESDSLLTESRRRVVDRLGADHPDTRLIDEERRRLDAVKGGAVQAGLPRPPSED